MTRIHMPSGRPEAFAWMALAASLFALMNLFARLAGEEAHWSVAAAVRAGVGAVVAISIGRLRGVVVLVRPSRKMWLRSIWGTLAMGCSFYALTAENIPLGDAVALNNMTPLILAVLAPPMLGEFGGRRVVLALPMAVVGVMLIVRPPFLFSHGSAASAVEVFPAVVALCGAFMSALAMLALRSATASENAESIAAHFSLLACALFSVLALLVAPPPPAHSWPALMLAGLAGGGAQVAMTRSYRLEQVSRVSSVGYLQVVFGTTLGALVLHERLPWSSLLGIALVVAAGLVLTLASVLETRRLAERMSRFDPGPQ